MKTRVNRINNIFRKATVLMLALFVVILVSSCSPETMQLCSVNITTEDSSRSLSAIITDPLDSLNIYYRTIYKGTGSSYGDMSDTTLFKRLDSSILLSQGLWDVEVLFSNISTPTIDSSIATNYSFSGSARNVFINLNTTSITIKLDTDNQNLDGSVVISSYSLKEMVATVRDTTSVTVSFYKYDGNAFNQTGSTISLTNNSYDFSCSPMNMEPGLYYAVFDVKGTYYQSTGTIFVDTIAFVVRSGMTTTINGSCSTANAPSSSSGNTVYVKPGGPNGSQGSTDIKNFYNGEFSDNTTYVIDKSNGKAYYLFPDNDTFVKTLQDGVDITIDTNGVNVINTNSGNNKDKDARTYFVLNPNTSLTLINSQKGTKSVYGCSDSKIMSQYQTNFKLNGGTLTIGQTGEQGQINLKGFSATANIKNDKVRHPAIEFTPNGGTVKLIGGPATTNGQKNIQIEETVIGIGTDPTITTANPDEDMVIVIDIDGTYINAQGNNSMDAYGIYINGFGRKGSIVFDESKRI